MYRFAIFLAAMSCGAATATAQDIEPRNSPDLPERLAPIDDMLRGGLLNDPTDIGWDFYGTDLTSQLVQEETIPGGGAAMRVTMSSPGEVYAGGLNIPLLARVNSGDQVTIGFFARVIESAAEGGVGRVFVRFQQNSEPYPGFGDQFVNVDGEWGFYEVTAQADRDLARDGIVALQFGAARQTVEIGQAFVVSGVRSVLD